MRLPFASVLLLSLLAAPVQAQADPPGVRRLDDFRHAEIGVVRLYKDTRSDTPAVIFASRMQVNTDGAPDSYHPDNIGITHICNGVSAGSRRAPCRWKADCLADFNRAKAELFGGEGRLRALAWQL